MNIYCHKKYKMLFYILDTYNEACVKCEKAMYTSDLNTDMDNYEKEKENNYEKKLNQAKRKKIQKSKLYENLSESINFCLRCKCGN